MTTAEKVMEKASAYVGYLEKRNGEAVYLTFSKENFTRNSGSANYTCFGKWYGEIAGIGNPNPWCAFFVSRVFYEACGEDLEQTKALLGGGLFSYTPDGANRFKVNRQWHTENPQPGDIIFFQNSVRINHVGIVYKTDTRYVYTIEGNTSGAGGVVANGGGVCRKSYLKSNARIAGYGRPRYEESASCVTDSVDKPSLPFPSGDPMVSWLKQYVGYTIASLPTACIMALQKYLNEALGAGLEMDGRFGPLSKAAVSRISGVKKGQRGDLVRICQIMLYYHGYDPNGFDGSCGPGCSQAICAYQADHGLRVDGSCGKATWTSLFDGANPGS